MAQNTNIDLVNTAYTLITDDNVTALRVQCGAEMRIQATVGTATTPTSDAGSVLLLSNQILASDITLAQLFPGVAGANRVYAKLTRAASAKASVSHA